MSELTRDRIRKCLRDLGLSDSAASKQAGFDRSVLGKFLRGAVEEMTDKNLRALAAVLGVEPAYLRGEIDNPTSRLERTGEVAPMVLGADVPIVGYVEAGAFRPIDWFDDLDLGVIVNGFNPTFSREKQFGWVVKGDSMNQAGINEDDELVCLDPWEAQVEIGDGDFVIVERAINGGHTREVTVKELKVFDDRYELVPHSSNPKHQPIVVPRTYDLGDDLEYRIIGIVISVTRRRPVKFSARKMSGSSTGVTSGASVEAARGGISSNLLRGAVLASIAVGMVAPCNAMALAHSARHSSEPWAGAGLHREDGWIVRDVAALVEHAHKNDPYHQQHRHLHEEVGIARQENALMHFRAAQSWSYHGALLRRFSDLGQVQLPV